MHFSTDFFISKRWIDERLDVHAIRLREGWNIRDVMRALPDPRLSSYNRTPSSALNILIMVPLMDPDAIKVPSPLTANAPTSDS